MQKSNGGYKIIDLKSPTIYDDIESNYRKPLLFTNIEIDGVEKDAVFASVDVEDSNFIVNLYNKTYTISQDNELTINDNNLYVFRLNFYPKSQYFIGNPNISSTNPIYIELISNNRDFTIEDFLNKPITGYIKNNDDNKFYQVIGIFNVSPITITLRYIDSNNNIGELDILRSTSITINKEILTKIK